MAADMAVELKKQNVACVSLWPGAVMTEHVNDFLSQPQDEIVIFLYLYFLPLPPPPPHSPPPLSPPLAPAPCLSCICRIVKRSLMSEKLKFVTLWDWMAYSERTRLRRPFCQKSAFKCKLAGRYKDLYALLTPDKSLWKWLGLNRLRSRPCLEQFFFGVIGA